MSFFIYATVYAAVEATVCSTRVISLALVVALFSTACGLDSDGSHKAPGSGAVVSRTMLGRYQTESIRLGVARPLLLLIDTATGLVMNREILGPQKFVDLTEESAPGANLKTKIPGRYDVKVIPGRRGSALLRLDTVTGKTWFFQLGSSQSRWHELESSLDDEPDEPLAPASRAPTQSLPGALEATGGRKPALEDILVVLTEPGYEIELRVWTASQLATLYPGEAADLLSGDLKNDDPKVMIAIIEGLEIDADRRVRAAIESLRGHENAKVANAVRKKLAESS